MMADNRIILFHKPTGNFIALGKRMKLGWYSAVTGDGLNEFFQSCERDLLASHEAGYSGIDPWKAQDDFILLMEDVSHAPHASSDFRWERVEEDDPDAGHKVVLGRRIG